MSGADWKCEHAPSGCNYPEGECLGICMTSKSTGTVANEQDKAAFEAALQNMPKHTSEIDDNDLERLFQAALDYTRNHVGEAAHPDDVAVDKFAAAMKEKLAVARNKGRRGWEQMDAPELSAMLREHVEKGDPRDVANFSMFLWNLGQPIVNSQSNHIPDTGKMIEWVNPVSLGSVDARYDKGFSDGVAESKRLNARNYTDCKVNPISSAMCNRGTEGCEVDHHIPDTSKMVGEPVVRLADHPIQQLKTDKDGVLRFKENSIVRFLTEGRLNELAAMEFPREDWVQLAQLIGYSLSGWGTLSYVNDEDWERANQTPPAPVRLSSSQLLVIGAMEAKARGEL